MNVLSRRSVLFSILAAIGIGVRTYVAIRPSDEARIRKQLSKLEAAVRVREADVQGTSGGRLSKVSDAFDDLFDPDVRVSIPELTSLAPGRPALAQLRAGASQLVPAASISS